MNDIWTNSEFWTTVFKVHQICEMNRRPFTFAADDKTYVMKCDGPWRCSDSNGCGYFTAKYTIEDVFTFEASFEVVTNNIHYPNVQQDVSDEELEYVLMMLRFAV